MRGKFKLLNNSNNKQNNIQYNDKCSTSLDNCRNLIEMSNDQFVDIRFDCQETKRLTATIYSYTHHPALQIQEV